MTVISEQPLILDSLPIFPIAGTVLFPGIVLPLQIDNSDNRTLIEEIMKKERILAVVMIKPGKEEDTKPPVCDTGVLGKIIHCEKIMGINYNVLIQGIDRIQLLEELPFEKPYRRFKARLVPQPTQTEAISAQSELIRLQSCIINLANSVSHSDEQLIEVIRSTTDPIQLADILSATVVTDVLQQQELLATCNLKSRLSKLIDAMVDVLAHLQNVSEEVPLN